MDQPGPSSSTTIPQLIESPESPTGSNASGISVNNKDNVPRIGIEFPLGIGLETSSEDEYEEPSSEEENVNNVDNDDGNGPVNQAAQIDYGFDEDFIGDNQFTLFSRRDIYLLKGWRAYVLERQSCRGFLVPEPPIPEPLVLVLRVMSGSNWQKAVLSGSGECIIEMLSAAISGYSITTARERREFLRLFGVWANSEFRAGLRNLAARGGFLDLDYRLDVQEALFWCGRGPHFFHRFSACAAYWYVDIGIAQTSFLKFQEK